MVFQMIEQSKIIQIYEFRAETKLQKIAAQLKNPDTEEVVNNDFEADSSDYDMGADKESSEEYESEGVDSNEDADQSQDDNKSTCADSRKVKKKLKKRRQSGTKTTTLKPRKSFLNCELIKLN